MTPAIRLVTSVLGILITPAVASGQAELCGKVLTDAGVAIADATITLSGIGYSDKLCIPVSTDFSLLRCAMTVYLDRVRIAGKLGNMADSFVNDLVVPIQVAAMEIYPRGVGAPHEFQPQNGTCGVVLIWSK